MGDFNKKQKYSKLGMSDLFQKEEKTRAKAELTNTLVYGWVAS